MNFISVGREFREYRFNELNSSSRIEILIWYFWSTNLVCREDESN